MWFYDVSKLRRHLCWRSDSRYITQFYYTVYPSFLGQTPNFYDFSQPAPHFYFKVGSSGMHAEKKKVLRPWLHHLQTLLLWPWFELYNSSAKQAGVDYVQYTSIVVGASLSEPHTSDATYFRSVRLCIYIIIYVYVCCCPPKPPTHAHMLDLWF